MKLVKPSAKILSVSGSILDIERAGRVCYKSEERIGPETAIPFVRSLIQRGHEAVLEHVSATANILCDRGVSHEIVRHRLASYCQESTRYVNYGGTEIQFVLPHWLLQFCKEEQSPIDIKNILKHWLLQFCKEEQSPIDIKNILKVAPSVGALSSGVEWYNSLASSEHSYQKLIGRGVSPQDARAVLPNALKTELIMTANLREWRHFLKLRTSPKAHPDMQIIAKMIGEGFKDTQVDIVFEDINGKEPL